MMYELLLLYLGKQFINMVLALHWLSQVAPDQESWLIGLMDLMIDSSAMDTWFLYMVIVILWSIDCILHEEGPAQNLRMQWIALNMMLQEDMSISLSDSPILVWH